MENLGLSDKTVIVFLIFLAGILFCTRLFAQNNSQRLLFEEGKELRFSRPDSALLLHMELEEGITDTNSPWFADFLVSTGNLYSDFGETNRAITYYLKALNIREKNNQLEGSASILNNLGNMYHRLGNENRALDYLNRAQELYRQSGTEIPTSMYNNLGLVYFHMDQFDSAEMYYDRCLEEINQNDQSTIADQINALDNLGELYAYTNRFEKAMAMYRITEQMQRERSDKGGLAWTLSLMSLVQMELGQFMQAESGLKEALELSQKAYELESEVNALFNLIDLYQRKGQMDSASFYLNEYWYKKDELLSYQIDENIQNAEARYNVQKIRAESDLFKERAARLNVEAKQQKTTNFVLASTLALMLIALFVSVRFYQQRRHINLMNLQLKEQELAEVQAKSEAESLKSMLIGQERERNRIAWDLHDRVGNLLATLKMSIRNNDQELQTGLLDDTVQEVRNIAENLSGDLVEKHGLIQALRELKHSVEHTTGIPFHQYLDEKSDELNSVQSLEVYRIVQELISNTLKHAQAASISLQTSINEGAFNLIFEDDGIGFDKHAVKEGMGSRNVRSRVEFLKGKLHIDSQPGRGTIIIIDFYG